MDARLEQRLLSCPTLPSLPASVLELMRLSRQPDLDLRAMAECLSHDPALAARLLRIANSAALAFGDVATLSRAVVLLGSNTVLAAALSFSLARARRGDDGGGFDRMAYWRRAFYSAIGARSIADRWGLNPEEAFLAGLLQDLGMLALAETLAAAYGTLARDARGSHERLLELERAELGATHDEVSRFLAARWNLPERLREALVHAGPPPPGEGGSNRPAGLRAAVYASGRLAGVWLSERPADAVVEAIDAGRTVGLDREAVSLALAAMGRLIPEVEADFDVRLADDAQIQEVLDAARQALERLRRAAGTAPLAGDALPATPTALVQPRDLGPTLEAAFSRALERRLELSVVAVQVRLEPAGPEAAVDLLATRLAGMLRAGDTLGRRGATGLVAILPGTAAAGAAVVAERLRRRAEAFEWSGGATGAVRVASAAVGSATHDAASPFAGPAEILASAEGSLGLPRSP
ncbi:MAG TPA: HDOD domain-containing protein [Anaeromyxobacteraceae bacterium]